MKSLVLLCVVALLASVDTAWAGSFDPTIEVIPSLAPNAYGSPSYAQYVSNATYAIQHGLSTYGDQNLPSYYQAAPSTLLVSQNIVTGFSSWNGVASPGGAFASELGNRLSFGLLILGNGTKFSISQLSFDAVSTDTATPDSLGFGYSAGPNGYGYSSGYVGIIYGSGGQSDTGAGYTYITSGDNTQLVDEVVGRGSGNAWAAYSNDLGGTTLQDKIDNAVANVGPTPFNFTGTYTLNGFAAPITGSATVEFVPGLSPQDAPPVPEPITMAGLLLGVGALGRYWSRKRQVV